MMVNSSFVWKNIKIFFLLLFVLNFSAKKDVSKEGNNKSASSTNKSAAGANNLQSDGYLLEMEQKISELLESFTTFMKIEVLYNIKLSHFTKEMDIWKDIILALSNFQEDKYKKAFDATYIPFYEDCKKQGNNILDRDQSLLPDFLKKETLSPLFKKGIYTTDRMNLCFHISGNTGSNGNLGYKTDFWSDFFDWISLHNVALKILIGAKTLSIQSCFLDEEAFYQKQFSKARKWFENLETIWSDPGKSFYNEAEIKKNIDNFQASISSKLYFFSMAEFYFLEKYWNLFLSKLLSAESLNFINSKVNWIKQSEEAMKALALHDWNTNILAYNSKESRIGVWKNKFTQLLSGYNPKFDITEVMKDNMLCVIIDFDENQHKLEDFYNMIAHLSKDYLQGTPATTPTTNHGTDNSFTSIQ